MAGGAPEVRGAAFLEPLRHVRDVAGRETLDEIVADGGPAVRAVFAAPIRKLGWYPYDAYSAFLQAIDRHLGVGDGEYGRTLGGSAGERDLGTVFRIYATIASPERLIRASAKIWDGYYRNAGRMWAVGWEPASTVLRIEDFSAMSRVHCRLMEGWMVATMATIGCIVEPGSRETTCVHEGGPFHEFSAKWTRAR